MADDWEKTCQAALRETVTFLKRCYPDAERLIAQIEEQTVFDTDAAHPLFGKLCLGRQRLTLIPKMKLETLDLRNAADQEVKRQIEVWQTTHSFSAAAPLPWISLNLTKSVWSAMRNRCLRFSIRF